MLRWRRRSELKRHKLWIKLVACSFGMHLIFLVMLFVGYRDTIKLTFSMSGQSLPKKAAPVTLYTLPAPKRVAKRATMRRVNPRKRIAQKRIAKKTVTRVVTKKKATPKKLVQKTVKKPVPKKTMAKAQPKPAPKKVLAKTKPKPVQKMAKKTSPSFDKLRTSSKKKEGKRKLVKNSTQEKKVESQNHIDLSAGAFAQADAKDFIALQHELSKHWQPPVGIDQSCACAITAHIDRQGKIEDVTIDDTSGVLMFDVAARTAMLAMELPRWTWGKSLSITFKP